MSFHESSRLILHAEVSYIIDIACHWSFFPILPVLTTFWIAKSPIFSIFQLPISVAEQAGLHLPGRKTPKTDFLVTWLILQIAGRGFQSVTGCFWSKMKLLPVSYNTTLPKTCFWHFRKIKLFLPHFHQKTFTFSLCSNRKHVFLSYLPT